MAGNLAAHRKERAVCGRRWGAAACPVHADTMLNSVAAFRTRPKDGERGMDHEALAAETQADGAMLAQMSERLHGLHHKAMLHARAADFDALRLELEELRQEFGRLHQRDLSGDVDQDAHRAWRA